MGLRKEWTFSEDLERLSVSPDSLQTERRDEFKAGEAEADPGTEFEDRTEVLEQDEEEEEESRPRGRSRVDGIHSHVSRSENLE